MKCLHCGGWGGEHRSFCDRPITLLRGGERVGAEVGKTPRSCCGTRAPALHSSVCLRRYDGPDAETVALVRGTPKALRAPIPVAPPVPARGIPAPREPARNAFLPEPLPVAQGIPGYRCPDRRPIARPLLQRCEDFQLGLCAKGEKGELVTATATLSRVFRPEKIIATDTSSRPGYGTLIEQVYIGKRLQLPPSGEGILTSLVGHGSLGGGRLMDTCEKDMPLSITIKFLEPCEWYGTLFGKALSEKDCRPSFASPSVEKGAERCRPEGPNEFWSEIVGEPVRGLSPAGSLSNWSEILGRLA